MPICTAVLSGDELFGYIRPLKPELKIKDYETYRSVYCGLCKELGRAFGPFSRLTLNYDFAFLALLQLAVNDQTTHAAMQRCFLHPFRKRMCCQSAEALQLTASAAMLMVYHKNEDNLHDGGLFEKIGSLMLRPFTLSARHRAKRIHPVLDDALADMMVQQAALEQANCRSIDDAADPTAQLLSTICTMLSNNERQQRVLSRFGYLLGRWIYLIDAVDDLADDYKHKRYNPFLLSTEYPQLTNDRLSAIQTQAHASLQLTHGELTKAYQLLELYQHAEILENIVFLGLPAVHERVTSKLATPKP